jgi:hypothetical protein
MIHYLVVTADMISSRNIPTKQIATIPEKLKQIDADLHPLIPSMLFAGDEIQILFTYNETHHPYRLLIDLNRYLAPFRFRFGFGIGAVDLPINLTMAQNKGPVFIQARKALAIAKKDQLIAWLSTEGSKLHSEINVCFLLFTALTRKWTDKHWRRFFLYWDKRSIHKVAEIENVSPESINKFLKSAGIRTIIRSLELVSKSYE